MTSSASPTRHLISGRYLLPTWRQQDSIANGAVLVAGDTIEAIGTRKELRQLHPGLPELHEPHGLIMPGLVNTHTHAPMSCFRGLADDLPLMTWLQDHIFPVEARLDRDTVRLAAVLSIAEMIKSGTTSFCDMYLFADEVAQAAASTGIRCWFGEVLYDFDSPCYGALANGLSLTAELLEQYRDHPLITATVDPHSVYTCAPSLLERCAGLAADTGSLLVIHLAETQFEVQSCRDQHGLTPVLHLDRLGLLGRRTLAAHCVWLEESEMAVLRERGVKVAHCVESNLKLASGVAPIPRLLEYGVTVGLGTDGSASNNDVDLFSEMNSVAKVHKGVSLDPTVMSAETTLRAATLGGAEALCAEDRIGTLAPGKQADLIVLDLDQPHLTPLYNIPSHLVYAARGADVIHSLIAGRLVMKNRHLQTIDEAGLLADMQALGDRILQIRDTVRTTKNGNN
jgi:5-methylthioadenosine/S-adenosylhomocysteine deaminase